MDKKELLKIFNEVSESIWNMTTRGYANAIIYSAISKYSNELAKIIACPFCEYEKHPKIVDKENQLSFDFLLDKN